MQQECTVGGDGEQRSSGMPGLLKDGGGTGGVDSSIDIFDIEEFLRLRLKLRGRKIGEAEHEAMRRQNYQTGTAHIRMIRIDESRHYPVVGGGEARARLGCGSALVPLGQGRFLAGGARGRDQ